MTREIDIIVNARIHLGFLDLHGGLGRDFGSIGVTLDNICTHITVVADTSHRANRSSVRVRGKDAARALQYAETVAREMNCEFPLDITVHSAIPSHSGLGSGTQLALSIGRAVARLMGRQDSTASIATMLGRGKRCSIGIASFDQGGFILDGGRGGQSELSPVLSRLAFPEQWRFILLMDRTGSGLHGKDELVAFDQLPEFSETAAAHLCRLTLMRLLPGVVEQDINAFGSAVTEIQQVVGDHFSLAQGGRFASSEVAHWLNWFTDKGASGVGQSSWGPTGFVICESAQQADAWLADAIIQGVHNKLDTIVCGASNTPSEERETNVQILSTAVAARAQRGS